MMTEAVTAALTVNELDEKELECVTGGGIEARALDTVVNRIPGVKWINRGLKWTGHSTIGQGLVG